MWGVFAGESAARRSSISIRLVFLILLPQFLTLANSLRKVFHLGCSGNSEEVNLLAVYEAQGRWCAPLARTPNVKASGWSSKRAAFVGAPFKTTCRAEHAFPRNINTGHSRASSCESSRSSRSAILPAKVVRGRKPKRDTKNSRCLRLKSCSTVIA